MLFLNVVGGFGVEIGDFGRDVCAVVIENDHSDDLIHFNLVPFHCNIHRGFGNEPAEENDGIAELGIIGGDCPQRSEAGKGKLNSHNIVSIHHRMENSKRGVLL